MQPTVSEKVQEQFMSQMFAQPDNAFCADCTSRSPCWVSLNFGTFICFNCSGEHRHLGMHITRVKSCKIDNWSMQELQLFQSIGNAIANKYWEGKTNSMFRKPSEDASPNTRRVFIKEKYVKKTWTDETLGNPVEKYHQALQEGRNPALVLRATTSAPPVTKVGSNKPELGKLGVKEQTENGKNHK